MPDPTASSAPAPRPAGSTARSSSSPAPPARSPGTSGPRRATLSRSTLAAEQRADARDRVLDEGARDRREQARALPVVHRLAQPPVHAHEAPTKAGGERDARKLRTREGEGWGGRYFWFRTNSSAFFVCIHSYHNNKHIFYICPSVLPKNTHVEISLPRRSWLWQGVSQEVLDSGQQILFGPWA